ncbi:MAG TPA: 5-oxoprolinase subunit PxpB [Burkholderiales bacterium]
MAAPLFPRLVPMGDRALVIEFGDAADPVLSSHIAAVAQHMRASPPAGVLDIVPTYTTLAVHYDPAAVGDGDSPYEALAAQLASWLEKEPPGSTVEGRAVEIPVCYGGEFGEDLDALANRNGLQPEEVMRLHSAARYHVHMLGFVPGFAYLGGLDPRLATPRRDSPRPKVPAGSVAIGGSHTGIFPLDTPGGWHLIGRTPLRLFTPESEPPCLLNAGDTVRFVPIDAAQFASLSQGQP